MGILAKFKHGFQKSSEFALKLNTVVQGLKRVPIIAKLGGQAIKYVDEVAPAVRVAYNAARAGFKYVRRFGAEAAEAAEGVGAAIAEAAPILGEIGAAVEGGIMVAGEALAFETGIGEIVAAYELAQWVGNEAHEFFGSEEPRGGHTASGTNEYIKTNQNLNGHYTPAQSDHGHTAAGNNPNSVRPQPLGASQIRPHKRQRLLEGSQPPIMDISREPHHVNTDAHPEPSRASPFQQFGDMPDDPRYPNIRDPSASTKAPVSVKAPPYLGAQPTSSADTTPVKAPRSMTASQRRHQRNLGNDGSSSGNAKSRAPLSIGNTIANADLTNHPSSGAVGESWPPTVDHGRETYRAMIG